MGQTIAEAIYAEGETKGALATTRKLLRQLLEERFGALSEEVRQKIETATNLERLEAAVLQAHRIHGTDDLHL